MSFIILEDYFLPFFLPWRLFSSFLKFFNIILEDRSFPNLFLLAFFVDYFFVFPPNIQHSLKEYLLLPPLFGIFLEDYSLTPSLWLCIILEDYFLTPSYCFASFWNIIILLPTVLLHCFGINYSLIIFYCIAYSGRVVSLPHFVCVILENNSPSSILFFFAMAGLCSFADL